jgi:ubiquitin C-terminal hydrolase
MNIEKYKNKGLSGLANLGNTCYINTCMQILSHTYELNNFLEKDEYKKKLNNKHDSVLLVEWDNLRKVLWENNCIISPGKFIKTIQNVSKIKNQILFSNFNQNDVSEFLIFIIDCFHNALSREVIMNIQGEIQNEKDKLAKLCFEKIKNMYSKDYSEIWNMFYGIHISKIVNISSEEIINMNPEPFFIINLPIPLNNKTPNLYDCFDLYTKGDIIEDYLHEKTNTRGNVEKKIDFWSLPSILVIDIKRYNTSNRKNQMLIDFPLNNLDLSKYIIGYNKDSYIYDLYGICNHSGSVMGGHYTAFIKNANNTWYHFNDTSVIEISKEMESKIISPKAYCFFYRKRC